MTGKAYVLDTSALMALIENEEGAARVADLLRHATCFITFVTVLELYYLSQREIGKDAADSRYAFLKASRASMLWQLDEPTLLTAARLKVSGKISIVDAINAAFAIQLKAVLLHKDPELASLMGDVAQEALPLKHKRGA